MKKALYILAACLMASYMLVSCETEEQSFDQSLLVGKWLSDDESNLYYKYFADGTGSTWDEDEVLEEEAQEFTWTLVNADLTQIHIMEMGGTAPKYYTVSVLTSTTLEYYDDYTDYSFAKVSK